MLDSLPPAPTLITDINPPVTLKRVSATLDLLDVRHLSDGDSSLLALWERSPLRLREIAERLYLEPATVSPLIGRLEAAGLVTRARSANDERAVDIALTDEGVALRERALAVPGEVVARLGYSIERLERLRDELTSLLDAAHRVN